MTPTRINCTPLLALFVSIFVATVSRDQNHRDAEAFPARIRPRLQRALFRVPLLPLPAHRRLRGLRLGLDHCAEALQGQLLLRGVWAGTSAEVPSHAPGKQGESARHSRALLHPHQDVPNQHALLQPPRADHLRQDPVYGRGSLRLLLKTRLIIEKNADRRKVRLHWEHRGNLPYLCHSIIHHFYLFIVTRSGISATLLPSPAWH